MNDCPLISELFTESARKYPDRTAVRFAGESLTYAELDLRSARVAAHLRQRGVGAAPDHLVGLLVDPGIDMVVGVLGILRAGAAYVPLDTTSPSSRLQLIVDDAQPDFVLTSQDLYETARELRKETEPLLIRELARLDAPGAPPTIRHSPDSIAYVIYTSGTTGRPKGVMNTHRNVARLLSKTEHWYQFNCEDVVPLFHSIAFDVSVWELWTALCYGGTLIPVPKDIRRSPAAFRELLQAEGVTLLNQTPSAFQMLVQEEPKHLTRLTTLRAVVFAGEKLNFFKLRDWVDLYGTGQPKLINMYGITETCVHVTYYEVTEADVQIGVHSRIGDPIGDLTLHILDANRAPVTGEQEGELYVEGPGLARGYFKRPELTAERFVDNPFGPGKLYRSGDIVKRSATGALEYIGRNDFQIKIRGFRIELGEVERAILSHPGVEYAVAAKVDDRLVAWFAPLHADLESVRAHVRGAVPDYMVPLLVPVARIPLNTNGKVDLPALQALKLSSYGKGGAPVTATEKLLAQIWQAELGTGELGLDDNYFDLGGDSIRALRLQSRVQDAGYDFSIHTLYSNATIRTLAACLTQRDHEPKLPPFALLSEQDRARLPADAVDAYPLSSLQGGMVFESLRAPGTGIYHDVYSYCVRLPLEEQHFKDAVAEMVRRHPVARTSLHQSGFSEPVQIVHATADARTTIEDISGLGPAAQQRAVVNYIDQRKNTDWDFTLAPLVHFHAQRRGDAEFQIQFSFHHAVLDGWSLSAFLTELVTIYSNALQGHATPEPEFDCSFADYIGLERAARRAPSDQRFWELRAEQLTYEPLPQRPVPATFGVAPEPTPQRSLAHVMSQEYDLATAEQRDKSPMLVSEVSVSKETSARIKDLAAEWNVPLHIALLAVHFRVLAVLYGRRTLTTGVVTNGRPERKGGDQLLGLFLNVVPIKVTLEPNQSWKDLCDTLMREYQTVLEHRRYPLVDIQEAGSGKLFDTVFNFVEFHVYANLTQVADVDWSRSVYFEANEFPLVPYFIVDERGQLLLRLYCSARHSTSQQLLQAGSYYARALEQLPAAPHGFITSKPLLSGAEQSHILGQLSGAGGRGGASRVGVLERIAEQVRLRPDLIAAEDDQRQLTYAQLNADAEALAQALHTEGVTEGTVVALGLSRSLEMVTAVVACLRLGACYVPVDPTYPQERIDLLVRDSAPHLMLTEERFSRTGQRGLPHLIVDRAGKLRGLRHLTFEQIKARPERAHVALPSTLNGETLAYVIYTSGSSGVPKGVQITRDNVAVLVTDYLARFPLQAGDRMLQSFAFGFDGFQLEILPALSSGATLVFSELGGQLPERITAMTLTPSLLSVRRPEDFPDLRLLGVGGEALTWSHVRPWLGEGRRIFNLYGPTECTIVSTTQELTAEDADVGIGRPLPSYRGYVISELDEACPLGVPGELCIAGPGLAKGYLHRPEEDAAHFMDNPLASGERIYRTGDTVTWTEQGTLSFWGRRDAQVKLRGFRVELGEIEAILGAHPGVRSVVVVVHGSVLAAFYEPEEKDLRRSQFPLPPSTRAPLVGSRRKDVAASRLLGVDSTPLRAHAEKNLPAYMQPSVYVALDTLPRDANGKADRRALTAHVEEFAGKSRHTALVQPRDAIEVDLVRTFEELLTARPIGINDDFFALGGDSLKAIRLLTTVEQRTGRRLSLASVLAAPTPRKLAEALRERGGSSLVLLQARGALPPFFCVHPAVRTAFCYRELAAALGTEQPFYGMESSSTDEDVISLSELAARYITEIKRVQKRAPYFLGGWSAGGNIALEIAAQLEAQGDQVAFLALLDSRPSKNLAQHALTQSLQNDSRASLALVARIIGKMSGAALGGVFQELSEVTESERLATLVAKVEAAGILPEGTAATYVERFYADLHYVSSLVVNASVPRLPANTTVFVAQEPEPALDGSTALDDVERDPTLGWSEYGAQIRYVEAEGSHQTMLFSPYTAGLARQLGQALREAQRTAGLLEESAAE